MEPMYQAKCRNCDVEWLVWDDLELEAGCPECGSTAVEAWETF